MGKSRCNGGLVQKAEGDGYGSPEMIPGCGTRDRAWQKVAERDVAGPEIAEGATPTETSSSVRAGVASQQGFPAASLAVGGGRTVRWEVSAAKEP